MKKVWARRNGILKEVSPKTLTDNELCSILEGIQIDVSDSWMPEETRDEGYAAIKEAIRRLKEKKNKPTKEGK